MLPQLIHFFFGPLSKGYCDIYLLFGFLALLAIVLAIFVPQFVYVKNVNLRGQSSLVAIATLAVVYFLSYLDARIMYNVCQKAM
jgi:predicted Na+-dependent transporter